MLWFPAFLPQRISKPPLLSFMYVFDRHTSQKLLTKSTFVLKENMKKVTFNS